MSPGCSARRSASLKAASDAVFPRPKLEGMQVCQQVPDLLLVEDLAEPRHLRAAVKHDIAHAVIVGGHPADRQILLQKHALQTGAFLVPARVGFVTTVAVVVVDFAAGSLLWRETKFGVAFPALHVAGGRAEQHRENQKSGGDALRRAELSPRSHANLGQKPFAGRTITEASHARRSQARLREGRAPRWNARFGGSLMAQGFDQRGGGR